MFGQDDITWCVSRSKPIPVYFNLYKVFDKVIIILMVLLFISFCIAFYTFWDFDREKNYRYRNMSYIVLLIAMPIFIGFNANQNFRATRHKTRALYALISFYGFLHSIIYSSFILSLSATTFRAEQLSNVNELIQNGFQMRCTPTVFGMILEQTKVN